MRQQNKEDSDPYNLPADSFLYFCWSSFSFSQYDQSVLIEIECFKFQSHNISILQNKNALKYESFDFELLFAASLPFAQLH
jgi:hypothetical protein